MVLKKAIGSGDAGHEIGEDFIMRIAMGMKIPGMQKQFNLNY